MHEAFSKFKKLVEPWLPGFDVISVSAFGVKEKEERLILSARVLLLPPWSPPFTAFPLDSPIFWGCVENVPFVPAEFDNILDALSDGYIRLGSLNCALPKDPHSLQNTSFFPGHPAAYNRDPIAPRSPLVQTIGGSKAVLINRVVDSNEQEWHLRALNPPFVDLQDAYRHFGVPTERFSDQTIVELFAYPPIEIRRDSTIKRGAMKLHISMALSLDKKQAAVGFIAESTQQRGVIEAEEVRWRKKGKVLEGIVERKVGDVPSIQCFLQYGGTGLQQYWVVDPKRIINADAAIYSAFDSDFKILRELLFDPKKDRDARRFEDGVALLLSMLGFNVTQHGRSQKLSDGPDIIASTTSGTVVVVECTFGMPDEDDQVATVLKRTKKIKRSLSNTGWSDIEVQAAIVTQLPDSDISNHRAEAEGKGVLVLCAEDLETALRRVRSAADPDNFLRARLDELRYANLFKSR